MSEFFHGWRRKAGCVLLVMALVFMGGWIRSRIIEDRVEYSTREDTTDIWISSDNEFGVIRHFVDQEKYSKINPDETITLGPSYPTWSTAPSGTAEFSSLNGRRRWLGIGIADMETDDGSGYMCVTACYWSIALPLTLLSAYLLLWPGKRSERKVKANPD